jgi:carbonic anhydrase
MTRRSLISTLATLPYCVSNLLGQEWNYGDAGPEKWGTLDRSFSTCTSGNQQSPIDLGDGTRADLPALSLSLPDDRVTVVNNGHTIQVTASREGSVRIGPANLRLVQVHFHTPSEHAIRGRSAAMEVHFVLAHQDEALTVISALMIPGSPAAAFSAIMEIAPLHPNTKAMSAKAVRIRELLPAQVHATWRYHGSLTTPPCSENVDWIVFDDPVAVAQVDIDRFRKIFPMNARPRQPLHRRYILRG